MASSTRNKPGRKPKSISALGRKASTSSHGRSSTSSHGVAATDIFPHIEAIRMAVKQLGAEQVRKIVGLFE